jgi:2-polyprenyl-6-hydroxyphenyl methylase/3-demethylubiquinone-9 3-methyltransferase
LNPTRIGFIRTRLAAHFHRDEAALCPFDGLSLLDIGCGGGLAAEPMHRLGFSVTGIDASAAAIAVARAHAEAAGLAIDYRIAAAESLVAGGESFDVVIALELIEHTADPDACYAAFGRLVKPGGAFIGATLNRTARSFALAVVGAEYLFRWLAPGTHEWRKFLRPSEFVLGLRRQGLVTTELAGIGYDPFRRSWQLTPDLGVNYMLIAARQ